MTIDIKMRIFNTIIILSCSEELKQGEPWFIAMKKNKKFINSCLTRIRRISWPVAINDKDAWKRTMQNSAEDEIPNDAGDGYILQQPVPRVGHSPGPTRKRKAESPKKRLKAGT